MIQFNDDEAIILCISCDAEYKVTRLDSEEDPPQFCPFCGYDHTIDSSTEDDLGYDEDDTTSYN